MAVITYTKINRCAGGGHIAYTAIADGKTVTGVVQVADYELEVGPKPALEASVAAVAKANPTDKDAALLAKLNAKPAVVQEVVR